MAGSRKLTNYPRLELGTKERAGGMQAFFRGWKRQTGCVTLVMACVFAMGWARSFSVIDAFHSQLTAERDVFALSRRGCLTGVILHAVGGYVPKTNTIYFSHALGASGDLWAIAPDTEWHWNVRLLGFEFGKSNGLGIMSDQTLVIMPYWAFIIPLTLLSAWLLLSTPRKSNQKSPAPARVNGA